GTRSSVNGWLTKMRFRHLPEVWFFLIFSPSPQRWGVELAFGLQQTGAASASGPGSQALTAQDPYNPSPANFPAAGDARFDSRRGPNFHRTFNAGNETARTQDQDSGGACVFCRRA